MDPRTDALLFLLDEKVKQHPSSQAAMTAKKIRADVEKAERPTQTIRPPVTLDTSTRVPIAGSDPRPRDIGEDKGAIPGSAGTEGDLL